LILRWSHKGVHNMDADAIVALVANFAGETGTAGTLGTVVVILIAMLRAGAATASKYISDEKLGKLAGPVNYLGGNTRQASNAAPEAPAE
jgi:hypothetical protein